MKTADDYLVSQISEKIDFLKNCSKGNLNRMKKDFAQVVEGKSMDGRSELRAQVDKTLEEFKTQANSGRLTREYKEAVEVIQICVGCCGLIHNQEYWQKCTIGYVHGNAVEGYKLSSEWRNQFKVCSINVDTKKTATGI